MERTLVRITDTVPVAAAFASALEEACSSAVTDLYPRSRSRLGIPNRPLGALASGAILRRP
jgi:hypothetical protein